ncbi:MAG TPA: hypothetical protein DEA97_18195 [Bacteroidales bacterium]|nr:MAG: hypothetical protein UR43_C0009G0016 [candidate division TM6 bacterium GW2011_GWF2_33_332]OFY79202.1 MAG: hypothetical protein A2281_14660 [Bacteroidetes bacterium RIFOXYA12_FULL_38_20]HBS88496.1 hypothetical protein [Bacteroidales bacterium]
MKKNFLTIIIALLFFSCQKTLEDFSDLKDLFAYLENPENGLAKEKTINNVRVKVKYLPSEYMMIKDNPGVLSDNKTVDSLMEGYNRNLYLLVSFEPATEQTGDVVYEGLSDYREYSQRMNNLNFKMDGQFFINDGKTKHYAVSAGFENVYSLKDSRELLLIFRNRDMFMELDRIDLVYEDNVFETGINHYVFMVQDIKKLPKINFEKLRI